MRADIAVDIVARQIIAEAMADDRNVQWEDYPEIGQNDWDDVCSAIDALARFPGHFLAAYETLSERAEKHA